MYLSTLPKWSEGMLLNEDNYLLKVKGDKGFLSKLTIKEALPKPFLDWGFRWGETPNTENIYIITNEYLGGWIFEGFRIGKSQNWAKVRSPLGYILEIYLENFEEIIRGTTMLNGLIRGLFKWEGNKLLLKNE